MATRWLDLLDPTAEELAANLPAGVDPELVVLLAARPLEVRAPRPVLEPSGPVVVGLLVAFAPLAAGEGVAAQEVGFVAGRELLVTVRKSPRGAAPFDIAGLAAAAEAGVPVGALVHRLVDDVADSYLELLDAIYLEIDELEDTIDELRPAVVRLQLSELRHDLLYRRRTVSATRAVVRRVIDGRVDVGTHALFPADVERRFADTYDTLVRVTEELDVARDLLSGVRDHLQAKISETQNEVGKKLTVIASLVLVPSLVVGFYGQNFEGAFDEGYWTVGISTGLILGSTLVQLALFRWRRWI